MTSFPFPAQLNNLIAALKPAETRLVGGAVRAILTHTPITDFDLATTATPTEVMARLQAADIKVIPTGIEHGTVTAVINHQPYEITTLRQDVTTDGRRATVSFTDDFTLDSTRRDFTINALYLDEHGHLFDPQHGQQDLTEGIVRFIGDAPTRIQEDALRILRFCRFSAHYADTLDAASWQACQAHQALLTTLSAERISQELNTLMALPRAGWMLHHMQQAGLLNTLNLPAFDPQKLAVQPQATPLQRWFLWASPQLNTLFTNPLLTWSKAQKTTLQELTTAAELWTTAQPTPLVLAYRTSKAAALFTLQCAGNTKAVAELEHQILPTFPLTGQDVLDQGLQAGPQVGKILTEIENWWLAADFPDREACLRQLQLKG